LHLIAYGNQQPTEDIGRLGHAQNFDMHKALKDYEDWIKCLKKSTKEKQESWALVYIKFQHYQW